MIDRKTIFVQNINFFDILIDEKNDTFFKRSRIIFDTNIKKNKNFNDVKNEKIIDRNDKIID